MEVSNTEFFESLKTKYAHMGGDLFLVELSCNNITPSSVQSMSSTPLSSLSNITNVVTNLPPNNSGARKSNLGLSLSGNRDRSVYSVFVCGIHPQGIAGRDGRIQVGDQLLEANGVQLLGRCHLNAGAILQQIPGLHVRLVLLRRPEALKEMAVKPITQFTADDNLLAIASDIPSLNTYSLPRRESHAQENIPSQIQSIVEKYYNYVHTFTLSKGSQGLGILIAEDKNPLIKTCVRVTGVQPCSSAEQAGIQADDWILSVNQSSLIGVDYETAAALMKSADGLTKVITIRPPKSGLPAEENIDPASSLASLYDHWIEINKNGKALGIQLIASRLQDRPVLLIHELTEGGAAHSDGRLRVGDVLRQVNEQSLHAADVEYAYACISRCVGPTVRLLIHRFPLDFQQITSGSAGLNWAAPEHGTLIMNGILYQVIEVTLNKRPNKGLGMSVVERAVGGPGAHITHIVPNGITATDGRLRVGDYILAVNNQDMSSYLDATALVALKCALGSVRIKVARLQPGQVTMNKEEMEKFNGQLEQLKVLNNVQAEQTNLIQYKAITLNRLNSSFGFSISPDEEELVASEKMESTEKVSLCDQTILSNWGEAEATLTISRDWVKVNKKVPDSKTKKRNIRKTSLDITDILPGGACDLNGRLKKGDKLIQINGKDVKDMTQSEVVSLIRTCPGPLQLIAIS